MTLTHGELFAGISGFGQGFERHGIETKWHVEIDKTAQSVLRRHYPNTLLLDDVRTVGAHNLPRVDVITFGSPCQDLSVGKTKRKGLAGDRSGLFYDAIQIIGELRPTFAVWENVSNALSSNGGRDFASVLAAFLQCGARDIAWRVFDTCHFGLPQHRERIFLVADFADGGGRAAEILFRREPIAPPLVKVEGKEQTDPAGHRSDDDGADREFRPIVINLAQRSDVMRINRDGLVPTLTQWMGTGGGNVPLVATEDGIRKLTPIECERLHGMPDNWTQRDQKGRFIADSARYRMLGNPVSVPIAALIGKRIAAADADARTAAA